MSRGQLMEPGDPFRTFGQPATTQLAALLIFKVHIVVGLRPVHPGKDQFQVLPPAPECDSEPEDPGGPLIDQCSKHAIPPAIPGNLTTWQGHDLSLEFKTLPATVLTCQRLSDHPGPASKTKTTNPY